MAPAHSYGETLLSIQNLTLDYGDRRILNNINMEIKNVQRPDMKQGQIVALLGLSGCGKTQLFRCISGLNKPSYGQVVLKNSPKAVTPGEVGVVQQAYPLLNHRTVLGNLLLPKASTKEKAMDLLSRFGLADKANSYPVQLSGGQRQRVAILQQVLMDNHFLLMDEPFSGLDIVAKANVCEIVQEVTTIDEHNTVLFTTHDIEVAVALAERVWVMGVVRDHTGKSLGASIIREYNLIELGIAWQKYNFKSPEFFNVVTEIKELFKTL